MGIFSEITLASTTRGGLYFKPGVMGVKILKVSTFESRKADTLFCIDGEIVSSETGENVVGTRPSQVINMSQDAAMGNVKGFLVAAASALQGEEVPESEITEETAEFSVGPDNPFGGITLTLEAVETTTRAGNPFTIHRWRYTP